LVTHARNSNLCNPNELILPEHGQSVLSTESALLIRELRCLLQPLQTEMSNLRHTTRELQHQVSVLKHENQLHRQLMDRDCRAHTNATNCNVFSPRNLFSPRQSPRVQLQENNKVEMGAGVDVDGGVFVDHILQLSENSALEMDRDDRELFESANPAISMEQSASEFRNLRAMVLQRDQRESYPMDFKSISMRDEMREHRRHDNRNLRAHTQHYAVPAVGPQTMEQIKTPTNTDNEEDAESSQINHDE